MLDDRNLHLFPGLRGGRCRADKAPEEVLGLVSSGSKEGGEAKMRGSFLGEWVEIVRMRPLH